MSRQNTVCRALSWLSIVYLCTWGKLDGFTTSHGFVCLSLFSHQRPDIIAFQLQLPYLLLTNVSWGRFTFMFTCRAHRICRIQLQVYWLPANWACAERLREKGHLTHVNLRPEIQPQYMEQDRCLVSTMAKVMDKSGGGLCVCVYVCGRAWWGRLQILSNIRKEMTELPMSHSFLWPLTLSWPLCKCVCACVHMSVCFVCH